MGLISRLTAWLGDLFGGADGDDSSPGDEADATEAADADEDDGRDEDARLDPAAATETRVGATDDAVDALRDVRRSQAEERDETAAPDSDAPSSESSDAPVSESSEAPESSVDRNRDKT